MNITFLRYTNLVPQTIHADDGNDQIVYREKGTLLYSVLSYDQTNDF